MTSFDVDSLFTNVPLDETIKICLDLLYNNNKRKVKGLLRKHCESLLNIATKKSCFLFNDTYYTQLDGVAMGSPLGPTLANVFLGFHEKQWLDNCPIEFKPVFYKRYVDDIIVLFKHKSHVLKFKCYLNKQHQNINFTHEEEVDSKISFLDVLVTRTNDKLITSIYRKSTFSGMYSNFKSFIPLQYKHGLIFTLLHRAFMISYNFDIFHEEVCNLKNILLRNSYPLFVIDKCVLKFMDRLYTPKPTPQQTQKSGRSVICSLPFLGKMSLQVKSKLQNIFKECLPGVKINVIFKSQFRMSNMFQFKDKIPFNIRSFVVYQFKCSSCNASYIGETTRHIKVRMCEHLAKSFCTENDMKPDTTKSTSVTKHCHLTNKHKNDYSSFKVIGQAENEFHLKIKESLLVQRNRPSINKQEDSIPLYLFN